MNEGLEKMKTKTIWTEKEPMPTEPNSPTCPECGSIIFKRIGKVNKCIFCNCVFGGQINGCLQIWNMRKM